MPGTIQSLTKYPDCVSDRRGLRRLHISQHRVLAGWGRGYCLGRYGGELENNEAPKHDAPTPTKSSPLWLKPEAHLWNSCHFSSLFSSVAGFRPPASVTQNAAGKNGRDVQSERSERDSSGAADKSSLFIKQIDIYLHLLPQMSYSQISFFHAAAQSVTRYGKRAARFYAATMSSRNR